VVTHTPSIDVTVIVPTRNEERNIRSFLVSLPPDVPLIVVDSSDDTTPHIVGSERPDNSRVIQQKVSLTEARQLGAAAATTGWLLFTDADIVFGPTYFAALASLLRGPFDLLYGPKLSSGEYATYYRWVSGGMKLCDRLGVAAASGSNLLLRRHVFWLCGGFDLSLSCNEDSEIAWRAQRQGYRTRYVDSLVVYACDHRRIEQQGRLGKTAHSLARCALLYTGLMPERWRTGDWGYWSGTRSSSS
jgi:glycosyltransferase involved in cell wall biosynthesis